MLLGALVDLGVAPDRLRAALEPLAIGGWLLDVRRIVRCGLAAVKIDVVVAETGPERGWHEIESLLGNAPLPARARERALAIFRRLIEAEAAVHGLPFERVHLHEVGGADAIIDIVGACVALDELRVDEIVVSPLTTGFGEVRCAHGVYPVPAPATALLVRGIPVRGGEIEAERLTPTGAAILTTLAGRWGGLPAMRPLAVGHGAGGRDLSPSPNILRAIVGEEACEGASRDGEIAVIECAVDDATPQAVAFAAQALIADGALDAFTTPVVMKKGRAGHLLTALARPEDRGRLARRLLRETASLGVRSRLEQRIELERTVEPVETEFGTVGVKLGLLEGEVVRAWPEYEDCAALAQRHGVPLWRVQQAALEALASARDRERDRGGRS
jgi:hypothetical protein